MFEDDKVFKIVHHSLFLYSGKDFLLCWLVIGFFSFLNVFFVSRTFSTLLLSAFFCVCTPFRTVRLSRSAFFVKE
jgi:hypothetical protein